MALKLTKQGMRDLEAEVDQDLCISCGLCVSSCPEVFDWNHSEKAEVTQETIAPGLEDCVQDAADGCPTDAIRTD